MNDYAGVNPDLLNRIPLDADIVLEIGAGEGRLGQAWRMHGGVGRYLGVELFAQAAQKARHHLDELVEGDVESDQTLNAVDGMLATEKADALVIGDVLEHLRDPGQTLAALRQRVRDGGLCVACIPNVSHWSLVTQQMRGRWKDADAGLLDRAPLRFFTMETAVEMFQRAGWTVLDAYPRVMQPDATEAALKLLLPLAEPLGIKPDKMRRDLSAFQWVIRAVNGPLPKPLSVVALGLRKFAGVTEARIDYPLTALNTQPQVRAVWSSNQLTVPSGWDPGIFVLHRQFMIVPAFNEAVERFIQKGWVVVADMDDDPHHWKEYVQSNFHAFRAVHAVTVSTEPLAAMIRQWNPHVTVWPNALLQRPEITPSSPKGERPTIFFGALNRGGDWAPLREAIVGAARELGSDAHWVVVHDRAFHDLLPESASREFHPTLPPQQYLRQMARCDITLLPLADTPFNRLKSDLKFIESCAAGAVPICSPTVYGDNALHRDIGWFAEAPAEWTQAITALVRQPQELQRRRERGLQYVCTRRMLAHQLPDRIAHLRGLMNNRVELERQRQERLAAYPAPGSNGVASATRTE